MQDCICLRAKLHLRMHSHCYETGASKEGSARNSSFISLELAVQNMHLLQRASPGDTVPNLPAPIARNNARELESNTLQLFKSSTLSRLREFSEGHRGMPNSLTQPHQLLDQCGQGRTASLNTCATRVKRGGGPATGVAVEQR